MTVTETVAETKEQVDLLCKLSIGVPVADVERLVQEIEQTQAIMPFIDPTGYREIARTLPHHLQVVRAFLAFRRTLDAVIAREAEAIRRGAL